MFAKAATVLAGVAFAVVVAAPMAGAAPAQESGTHCRVALPSETMECFPTAAAARAGIAADRTLSTLYWDKDFKGHSLRFHTDGGPACSNTTSDVDYYVSDLGKYKVDGDGTWNNKASSVSQGTDGACYVKMYDKINHAGTASIWMNTTANLANFDPSWGDRASSLRWS